MVCTASFPCLIKSRYIEHTRYGALYKGELCTGCAWWKNKEPEPTPCPDLLYLQDMPGREGCNPCPSKLKKSRGWGGSRSGAGAPPGNLNRLSHGRQSRFLKRAIQKLAADPEMRVILYSLLRITTEGQLPQTTRKLILKYCETPKVKGRRLYRKVRQHHA